MDMRISEYFVHVSTDGRLLCGGGQCNCFSWLLRCLSLRDDGQCSKAITEKEHSDRAIAKDIHIKELEEQLAETERRYLDSDRMLAVVQERCNQLVQELREEKEARKTDFKASQAHLYKVSEERTNALNEALARAETAEGKLEQEQPITLGICTTDDGRITDVVEADKDGDPCDREIHAEAIIAHVEKLCTRITELEAELKRVAGNYVCTWCGGHFPTADPDSGKEILYHVRTCDKHPMRQLEKQYADAAARIAELERTLAEREKQLKSAEMDLGKLIGDLYTEKNSLTVRAEAAEAALASAREEDRQVRAFVDSVFGPYQVGTAAHVRDCIGRLQADLAAARAENERLVGWRNACAGLASDILNDEEPYTVPGVFADNVRARFAALRSRADNAGKVCQHLIRDARGVESCWARETVDAYRTRDAITRDALRSRAADAERVEQYNPCRDCIPQGYREGLPGSWRS